MKSNQELLAEFLEYERVKRRPRGIIHLRKKVPKLFVFLEESGLKLNQVRTKEALCFKGWLIETGKTCDGKYSPRTVNDYLTSAGAFYDFLKAKGLVHENPFKEIRKLRTDKKLPQRILKEKEMSLLLESMSHFEEGENLKHRIRLYRVHVIAELMYATGLRISEVAELKAGDIDFMRSLVHVREGKGGFGRTAYLNEYAREVLRLYLDRVRPHLFSLWNERNGSVFGMSWTNLGKMVNKTLKSICLEKGLPVLTSHGFRHALGYHLLRAGCNIRYIQSILGHRRLRNTEVYTKVEKEDLKAVLDACHPRSRWVRRSCCEA